MKEKLKHHFEKNKSLIKDNFVLFVSFFILNILGYLFHFYAGRKLGPSEYGVFGSLLSLIYIIGLPLTSIQTTITKFVADFKAKGNWEEIAYLLKNSLKKIFLIGLGVTLVYLLLSPFIASFLKIDSLTPVMLIGSYLFLALLLPITRGILQGLQKFKQLGASFVFEGITKLGLGVLLISIGLGVNGAILAFTFAYLIPFVLTFYFLRKVFRKEKKKFDSGEIYRYSFPVALMLVSLTGFFTIDILLVKHFLSAVEAGYYAAMALLGKVIFFGSMSVSMVMFPKIAELYAVKKNTKRLMLKSLFMVFLCSFVVVSFYFLFPEFVVNMLFGSEYLEIAGLIGFFSLFMGIFSLVYVLSFYNVSIQRSKFIYILILFNFIEGGLIYLFHESLMQIITILIGLIIVLFLILVFYTYIDKNERLDVSDTSIQ
ncbi:MAG: hypothetical protein CMH64_00180 [Nanoarchaeota archaeon]|nr:hypothetical protein [Nanoarchaeota archaeon]